MKPGSKILYLGAASGTTVSHVSDIIGPVSIDLWKNLSEIKSKIYAYIRARFVYNYKLGVEVMLEKLHTRFFLSKIWKFCSKKTCVQILFYSNNLFWCPINILFLRLQQGVVFAVEFSHRTGRELIDVAKKRTNIIPIVEDARHPHKYRMLVNMVDTIFADVAQPDQARIVSLNAQYFLKSGGHFVISIKVRIYIEDVRNIIAHV